MTAVLFEFLLILFLTIANGILAMSEIAVVSARKVRLQAQADRGDHGARIALQLADAPDRFLSTVQIGITLIGILAGALGGATIAREFSKAFARVPLLASASDAIAFGLVVLLITYLSLVIGELVPKRLALHNAEKVATAVSRPMRTLSTILSPIVRLLTMSTAAVLRLLRVRASAEPPVTEEEVRLLMAEGAQVGVFEKAEQDMVKRVLRLDDRRVSTLMTYRTNIVWLDLDAPSEETMCKIANSIHSRFPVARGGVDNIVGIAHAKDLLAYTLGSDPTAGASTIPLDLKAIMRPPLYIPESTPALRALERFKECRMRVALVIDEFGGLQGLVTTNDILEGIVGDIPLENEDLEPEAIQRADGSWLLDGLLPVDEFQEIIGPDQLPGQIEGQYETLGGFVMKCLGRVPKTGDHFVWGGHHIEVMDMDGYRVDKVLVLPLDKDPRPGKDS